VIKGETDTRLDTAAGYLKILISAVNNLNDNLGGKKGRRGPITGTPVQMDLLVSGSDPLAVDAACVKIMGGFARAIPIWPWRGSMAWGI
jgi:hypothetical protein